ncbi:MAG TPA: acetate kinase, partial [Clostridiales bacterium]|nr:acetate kinase [Clostridiales bacterium]
MNILVINCGSSSLKYQLIDSINEDVLAVGICERIGLSIGDLKHSPTGGEKIAIKTVMENHEDAVKLVLEALVSTEHGVIKELSEIGAIGHRVVHGGEEFATSTLITDEVIKAIEECNDLAPLHNPANLIGINACIKLMPNIPMVAVFDTAFHQTIPSKAFLYGIPYQYYE